MASLIADKQEDGDVVCCRVAGKGDFSGAAGAVYIELGMGSCASILPAVAIGIISASWAHDSR